MAQRSQWLFIDILNRTSVFDCSVGETEPLRGLSRDDNLSFCDDFFAVRVSGYRKVSSVVYGMESLVNEGYLGSSNMVKSIAVVIIYKCHLPRIQCI